MLWEWQHGFCTKNKEEEEEEEKDEEEKEEEVDLVNTMCGYQ